MLLTLAHNRNINVTLTVRCAPPARALRAPCTPLTPQRATAPHRASSMESHQAAPLVNVGKGGEKVVDATEEENMIIPDHVVEFMILLMAAATIALIIAALEG
jgi:hypothetical protein